MKRNLLLSISIFLLAGCIGGPFGRSAGEESDSLQLFSDSLDEEVVEARMIKGFIGTGTTMNIIELVSAEATDTLWLEMDEKTVRDATLQVGKEIIALVLDEPDGSLRVLVTMDVDEE